MPGDASLLVAGGYHPHQYVSLASNLPAWSRSLSQMAGVQGGDSAFNPSSLRYLLPLTGLGAALFTLAILSMASMNGGLIARLFFRSCACYPKNADKRRRERRLSVACLLFVLILLASVFLLYLANVSLDQGVSKAQRTMSALTSSLVPISTQTKQLQALSNDLSSALTAAASSCSSPAPPPMLDQGGALRKAAVELGDHVGAASKLVGEVVTQLSMLGGYVDEYLASDTRRYLLYGLAAAPIALVAAYCFVIFNRRSAGVKAVIAASVFYFYPAVLVNLPLSIVTTLLADLCVAPFDKIINVSPPGSRAFNFTSYYTTCDPSRGSNAAAHALQQAAQSTAAVSGLLLALKGSGACSGGDVNVAAMSSACAGLGKALNTTTTPPCEELRGDYAAFVDSAVCDHLFAGVLECCLALLLGSWALWASSTLVALLGVHFDAAFYEQVYVSNKDDEDDEDGEDEDGEEGEQDEEDEGKGEGLRVAGRPPQSRAEREGKAIAFAWASLDDTLSQSSHKEKELNPGPEGRVPDEDEEEVYFNAGLGLGFGSGLGLGLASPPLSVSVLGGAGSADFDTDGGSVGGVSVLTTPLTALSPEDSLHALAKTPMGREDDA